MILPLSKFSPNNFFDNHCTSPHYDLLGLFLLPERRACVSGGPKQASTVRQHLIRHPHHFYSWHGDGPNASNEAVNYFVKKGYGGGITRFDYSGTTDEPIESNADGFQIGSLIRATIEKISFPIR